MGLFMRSIPFVFITAFALLLSACGGEGDGSDITQFTITSTSGDGGSISPASITVDENETTSFTITPDNNYIVDMLTGCEGALTLSENTFTTNVIKSDCNLSVTFKLKSYAVTATAGQGGNIFPAEQAVIHGETASLTLTPDPEYAIDSVTGCGGSLEGNTYSTGIVTKDCSVSASFNLKSYAVTARAGQGGRISPAEQAVIHGETASFTLNPDPRYAIDSVTGCGGSLDGNTYSTGIVTKDCAIYASFNKPPNADAGSDQIVFENTTVTLDGSTSTDAEDDASGTPLFYRWQQTDNTDINVTLNDENLATPSFEAPSVAEATVLDFTLTVTDSSNDSRTDIVSITVNQTPPNIPAGKLNDTGITACWAGSTSEACPAQGYEGQDAEYGRDAQAAAGTLTKVGGGSVGFDFTKLDAKGDALSADDLKSGATWSCVQDNHTGLIWEVKTNAAGLHNKEDNYNWHNTDTNTNGDKEGDADIVKTCYNYTSDNADSFCNTQAFVSRVNTEGLCGATNWRLPNREELLSIVDFAKRDPAIDSDYFPNAKNRQHFSSTSGAVVYSSSYGSVWIVNFSTGGSGQGNKANPWWVRLVRDGQ
jgi:hypothetical protein